MGYTEFYIDHLTAFAAHADDERKMLEATCADMAQTANKLGVRFYVISHLSTPDGVPHEEGGRVFIRHFKGSRAIGYWAHFMFGIERDTQAEDLEYRARAKFRCLKDRFTGQATGNVLTMKYDPETGLQSVDPDWKWEEPSSGKQSAADHGFTNQDF
jgi:twinkle protein